MTTTASFERRRPVVPAVGPAAHWILGQSFGWWRELRVRPPGR